MLVITHIWTLDGILVIWESLALTGNFSTIPANLDFTHWSIEIRDADIVKLAILQYCVRKRLAYRDFAADLIFSYVHVLSTITAKAALA